MNAFFIYPIASEQNVISMQCDKQKIELHLNQPMISSILSFLDDPNELFHVHD